jgi:hypothetical protein
MGLFDSNVEASDTDIKLIIILMIDKLGSIQSNSVNIPEAIILSQYIPIRLAYQNGKSSIDLINFLNIEDTFMERNEHLPQSEINEFKVSREKRFKEYEDDWELMIRKSQGPIFYHARYNIFGDEADSHNIFIEFPLAIATSIRLARDKIGAIKFGPDNWVSDFLNKLKFII